MYISIALWDKILTVTLWILLAILVGTLIYVIFSAVSSLYYARALTYSSDHAKAKVVDKKHENATYSTTLMPIGKVLIPQTHRIEERNYVSLRVNDEVHVINDKDLYWDVEVGDSVDVIVHDGYNKRGILTHTYITLAH